MRSLIIILASIVLVTAGFGIYWMQQKPGGSTIERPQNVKVKPPRVGPGGGVGPAQGVWLNLHGKDGRRTARVRADQYDPITDDRVRVRDLEIEFFLGDGQVLRVLGKSGIINMQQAGRGAAFGANTNLAPSRGHLRDVTLLMYPSASAAARGRQDLTLTMNNASFDNEALKIQTEEFVDSATRTTVPGDQVPVHARGKYNFDGRGLELRWNDKNRRLDFLKVFHGERLEITNPGEFMESGQKGPERRGGEARNQQRASRVMIASADHRSALALARRDAAARPQPERSADEPRTPQLYRANFHDNVRITRGEDMEATASRLQIDFVPKANTESAEDGSPMEEPAPSRAPSRGPKRKIGGDRAASRPATARSAKAAAAPATAAATAPATRPAEVPVVVTWTGPLVVVPLEQQGAQRIIPGHAIAHLIGSPRVRQAGMSAMAGTLLFRTLDRSFELEQSGGSPVVLTDARGAKVVTPKLDFSQEDRRAHLYGPSHAILPVTEQGGNLSAQWADQCSLHFEPGDGQKLLLKRAEIRGTVVVDHPQLRLRSRVLTMDFDRPSPTTRATAQPVPSNEPATQPPTQPATQPAIALRANLRQLDATGDVHCELIEAQATTQPATRPFGTATTRPEHFQTIDCKHLELLTAKADDGRLYPAQVIADGDVHTTDPKQQLWSGRLLLRLSPVASATQPSTRPAEQMARAELSSLLADDNVRVLTNDGATARAEQLLVKQERGRQSVKLLGQPAVVTQEATTLTGPILQFYPDTRQASVLGAGTLRTVQQDGATTRPVEVKWQTGLSADGDANQVDCLGNVSATLVEADGTLQTTQSDRIKLILFDAPPATQPTTRPATSRPSSRPVALDAMGTKRVKQIVLIDNAVVTSTLLDDKGKLLRGTQLKAAKIDYDLLTRRLLVAVPGHLSMEDHTPRKADADKGDAPELKGQTAIVWDKQLDYNPAERKAIVDGNVRVRHVDEGDKARAFNLQGDKFVADLEPAPGDAAADKADPAAPPRMRLKHLRGDGAITFKTETAWLEASDMDFDPATHQLTIRGNNRRQARELYVAGSLAGTERWSFDQAIFDTQKWQIVDMKPFRAEIRRAE